MKKMVRAALRSLGYRIEGIRYTPRQLLEPGQQRRLEFDDVICRHMFDFGRELVFVQVGAFDGVSTDPLRKYIVRCGWKGVMLEPQPRPAAELGELYRENADIIILQAAVDNCARERKMYIVESDVAPRWVGGMASFEREHILKHEYLIHGLADMVKEITVNCIPFSEVLKNIPGGRVDLLQIDAEGADGRILSMFPFEAIRPAIVHWERKNLSRVQQEETLDLLAGYGYVFASSGDEDMLATLRQGA